MIAFRGRPSNSQAVIDKANNLWDKIADDQSQDRQKEFHREDGEELVLIYKDEFFGALQEILDEIHGCALCVGNGLTVYGDYDSISRAQQYVLLDTTHPIEKEDVKRQFARCLQMIEKALGSPVGTIHQVKKV